MNKLLTVVLGSALIISTAASATDFPAPTVYGRAHVSVGVIDNEDGSATQVSSRASRFGVKGKYGLDSDLTATYKFEFEVDTTDKNKTDGSSSSGHIKARTQYAGIKGNFGEIRVGRHDTAYKSATSKFDLWGDTYADFNNILNKSTHDSRADNSIVYVNKIGDVNLGISHAAGDDDISGDNDGSRTSIGATYKTGSLMLGGGYEDVDAVSSAFKLAASYKFNAFTLGTVVESVDSDLAGSDELNIIVTGAYKITEKGTIKAVYGQTDIDADGVEDPTMFAIGYDHKFNKKANVYVLATTAEDEGLNEAGKVSGDATVIAVGLKFNF